MPQKDAEKFIKEIAVNSEIRKSLYTYGTSSEIMDAIRDRGFSFELFEFNESISHLKVESPNEEQAIMLEEIQLWWNMLMYDGSIAIEQPGCTPAKCSTCSGC